MVSRWRDCRFQMLPPALHRRYGVRKLGPTLLPLARLASAGAGTFDWGACCSISTAPAASLTQTLAAPACVATAKAPNRLTSSSCPIFVGEQMERGRACESHASAPMHQCTNAPTHQCTKHQEEIGTRLSRTRAVRLTLPDRAKSALAPRAPPPLSRNKPLNFDAPRPTAQLRQAPGRRDNGAASRPCRHGPSWKHEAL